MYTLFSAAAQAKGWGHAVLCTLSGIALDRAPRQLCHHRVCQLWYHAYAGAATSSKPWCCIPAMRLL